MIDAYVQFLDNDGNRFHNEWRSFTSPPMVGDLILPSFSRVATHKITVRSWENDGTLLLFAVRR
jgi:hypothetical protein